jgi:hypothetical protein
MRSPGRREMARRCAGRRWQPEVYPMRGAPRELEQDREFYTLFQESKRLEARLPESQDAFNACINKIRARGLALTSPKTESASTDGRPS